MFFTVRKKVHLKDYISKYLCNYLVWNTMKLMEYIMIERFRNHRFTSFTICYIYQSEMSEFVFLGSFLRQVVDCGDYRFKR